MMDYHKRKSSFKFPDGSLDVFRRVWKISETAVKTVTDAELQMFVWKAQLIAWILECFITG